METTGRQGRLTFVFVLGRHPSLPKGFNNNDGKHMRVFHASVLAGSFDYWCRNLPVPSKRRWRLQTADAIFNATRNLYSEVLFYFHSYHPVGIP